MSKQVKIGDITIGGGAPIAVQSMLSVNSRDIEGNVAQAKALEAAGCDIVRVAVPNAEAVGLIPALKRAVSMPVVADIHFDHKLALASVDAGADKIRINPGNIGGKDHVEAVAARCRAAGVPIRVGVNAGSLEKELLEKYGGPTTAALVESTARNIKMLEDCGFYDIVVSVKSSDLKQTVEAYREIAARFDYPLHVGVTEAGTANSGRIKSAIGIGSLLLDDIGDTVRVSLTGDPVKEIEVAREILKATGKRRGVEVISCPTCGRTEIDIESIAEAVEQATRGVDKPLKVAVMGCVVNGPGEARTADVGIAGGKDCAVLFKHGEIVEKINGDYAKRLIEEIENM